MPFSTQVLIDFDLTEHGWEVVARFTPEDCIVAFTEVPTERLADTVGGPMTEAIEQAVLAAMEEGR